MYVCSLCHQPLSLLSLSLTPLSSFFLSGLVVGVISGSFLDAEVFPPSWQMFWSASFSEDVECFVSAVTLVAIEHPPRPLIKKPSGDSLWRSFFLQPEMHQQECNYDPSNNFVTQNISDHKHFHNLWTYVVSVKPKQSGSALVSSFVWHRFAAL